MKRRPLTFDEHEQKAMNGSIDVAPDFRLLFHRLTNQLGIILANAELLEAKSSDEHSRARAVQVISSALEAMTTIQDLRRHTPPPVLL